MPYLTFDEYEGFGFSELTEIEFNNLLPKASDAVDGITRHFYQFNDLETDHDFRKNQFKKAIAAQVEYFHEVGATSYESINNAPQSFSAGRTSVSNTSRFNSSGANETKSLVAEEVIYHLSATGLLYRGVAVRW